MNNKVYRLIGWTVKYNEGGDIFGTYPTKLEAEAAADGNGEAIEIFEAVSPYKDWPIDKPCYTNMGKAGHYAGLSDSGHPCIWDAGGTSHTQKYRSPEPELFEVCS